MTWNSGRSSRDFHRLISIAVELEKVTGQEDDHSAQTHALVDYAMHLAFYAGLTAIFLMITALIIKLMWNCDEEGGGNGGAERESENEYSRSLASSKKVDYGGTSQDLEAGSRTTSLSSDDGLYEGQICVICYNDQRDCFFVPCGHCVACHTCAARIMKEESTSCPICRGIIDKVTKLHIS